MQFDDLPPQKIPDGVDPNTLSPVPMISPYHRFSFAAGFSWLPPPDAPYIPSSPGQMIQWNQSMFVNGTPNGISQIGVGSQRPNPCFRFNLQSFNLGCNSTDEPCMFNITGMQNPGTDANDTPVFSEVFNVTACPTQANCSLTPVVVDPSSYANLTSFTVQLLVGNDTSRTWWGDDLRVGWTDNSCIAANCRSTIPNTVGLTRRRRQPLAVWRRMFHAV